jgi:hypothetical protein
MRFVPIGVWHRVDDAQNTDVDAPRRSDRNSSIKSGDAARTTIRT